MESTGASRFLTCMSWLLVVSYALLLGAGGCGVWLTTINFGHEELQPPTQPPENTTTTTTTTTTTPYPRRHSYYDDDYHRQKVPEEYKTYVAQTRYFANAKSDMRFYVAPLCFSCVVVASLTLLASLVSRQVFSFTFSLYSSMSLCILSLVMIFMHSNSLLWRIDVFDYSMAGWVIGIHCFFLLFLLAQILLCMWVLRQQQVPAWPTLNLSSVFTWESAVLTSRLILLVCTLEALFDSQIIDGFRGKQDPRYGDGYYIPRIRYPLYYSLPCCAAAFYNVVAATETTLSMLLGKLHPTLTTLSCLLSGLSAISIAVFSSPFFIGIFIGPYSVYPPTMNFAIGLSVLTLLHWLTCLICPSTLRTPPRIFTLIIEKLLGATSLDDITALIKTQSMRGMELIPKKMKHERHIRAGSLIFSLLSLTFSGIAMNSMPFYGLWSFVVLLCANAVTIMRTLPPLVMEHMQQERESIPYKQRLISLAFETPAFFVGGIAVCARSYGFGIFVGLMNILFAIFQALLMYHLYKQVIQGQHTAKPKQLEEEEKIINQEEEQSNPIDALA